MCILFPSKGYKLDITKFIAKIKNYSYFFHSQLDEYVGEVIIGQITMKNDEAMKLYMKS
jgi:uncharacterized protein YihD (DUF1040 family)